MMDISKSYERDEFLSFLRDRFLPDSFEPNYKKVNINNSNHVITEAVELGVCQSLDSQSLDMSVYEFKHHSGNDPRVTLSREAFGILKNNDSMPNVLAVFYNEDSSQWRLSLITSDYNLAKENRAVRTFSNPRRYSFLLGKNAKIKTPQRYLNGKVKDYNDLKRRFSIEVLNEEFFERLAGKYDKTGKLVKEGWYQKCFNDIKIDLSKASQILSKKIDDELKPQAVIRVIIRLMFIWFMKEKGIITNDFFTRDFSKQYLKKENTYYNAILQNLFFAVLNNEKDARRFRRQDESHYYDPERNDYGIFDVFRYKNFFKDGKAEEFLKLTQTIPFVNGGLFTCHDYKFSGKDLSKNKNNTDGNYIIDGFSDNQKDRAKISDEIIFQLIDIFNDYAFTVEENMPNDVVVALDPELLGTVFENLIGSYNPETKETARKTTGSFYTPREIVDYMCRESLKETLKAKFPDLQEQIDDLIDSSEDKLEFPQKSNIIAAITNLKILDPACGSGAFPMGMFNLMVRTIEKLQERKTTYKNKLDIITNCIYGVDIQNIAIEISKLRFFISLLVDYEIPVKLEDFEVLPNLETKFAVANTLVGLNLKGGDLFDQELLAKCKEITKVFAPFTQAKTPREKENIKNAFEIKKMELITLLENNNIDNDEIKKVSAWNPFNVCYTSPFFDSEIMFGIQNGFDIVIGNPPYAQVGKGIYSTEQFPYSEGKDKGKQNLYKLFIESAYNLSKNSGYSCLIVQSTILCDMSSQFTRELLLSKTIIKKIIEFPKRAQTVEGQVFRSVLQGTCIYISNKALPDKDHCFLISINNDTTTIKSLLFESVLQQSLINFYPESYCIPLIKRGEYSLLEKINNESIKLKDIIKTLSQGDINLTTSKAFIGSSKTKVKLLRGRNISKYSISYDVDEFVKIGHKDSNVKLNRKYNYLVCQAVTGTVDKWRLHFALTDKKEHFLFGHSANKVLLNDQINNMILLGILNSRLLDWYFRKTSTNNNVGGYEINQLPVILTNGKINDRLIVLVDKIIVLKTDDPQTDTSALERQIDNLVYRLYNLAYDEVKVIEPDFMLSRAEYEGGLRGKLDTL